MAKRPQDENVVMNAAKAIMRFEHRIARLTEAANGKCHNRRSPKVCNALRAPVWASKFCDSLYPGGTQYDDLSHGPKVMRGFVQETAGMIDQNAWTTLPLRAIL